MSQTAIRFSTVSCISRASVVQPSRIRSVKSSSKIEPTIKPHCAVPMPLPCAQHEPSGFLRHGSPPCVHSAIAVLYARVRYHRQLTFVSGGLVQRAAR